MNELRVFLDLYVVDRILVILSQKENVLMMQRMILSRVQKKNPQKHKPMTSGDSEHKYSDNPQTA